MVGGLPFCVYISSSMRSVGMSHSSKDLFVCAVLRVFFSPLPQHPLPGAWRTARNESCPECKHLVHADTEERRPGERTSISTFSLSTTIRQHGFNLVVFKLLGFCFDSNVQAILKLQEIWLADCSLCDGLLLVRLGNSSDVIKGQALLANLADLNCFCLSGGVCLHYQYAPNQKVSFSFNLNLFSVNSFKQWLNCRLIYYEGLGWGGPTKVL